MIKIEGFSNHIYLSALRTFFALNEKGYWQALAPILPYLHFPETELLSYTSDVPY